MKKKEPEWICGLPFYTPTYYYGMNKMQILLTKIKRKIAWQLSKRKLTKNHKQKEK